MSRLLVLVAITAVALAAGIFSRGQMSKDPEVRTGGAMVAISVPALSGDAAAGAAVFAGNCAGCHGNNADGRDGLGPPLVHIIYEPNHHGGAAFHLAVQNGVRAHHWRFGNMPPVAGVSPDQVDQIIAYVRTLQRANGIN